MNQKSSNLSALPIFLAFLCMGFGDVVGPLTSQVQSDFHLSNFLAGLLTFMGFIMFGLLSIPLGIIQDRVGKRKVLIFGLAVALLGLILPIIGNFSSFVVLLVSILMLGAGATSLQVAGNPIMRDVSPEGKYSRNLSLGQFVKAIGSLSGSLVPLIAAKYWGLDWKILFPIYSAFIALTIVYILFAHIHESKPDENAKPATFKSCLSLLNNKFILAMVMGIFLYVGAEVSMSSKLPNYLADVFSYDIKKLGLLGTLFFFIAIMTGRFFGSVILNWMSPKRFLVITTILSIVGNLVLFFAPTATVAFVSIFIIGFGFANIFPLIFSITVDSMPEKANEISGLMVTAIIGGAVVPLLFGLVADYSNSIVAGFAVPLACLAYILLTALSTSKQVAK
ncbi:MFS transporter [Acetobacteroides hydrogenigenes]|uniref:Fucose permease n=1 Tax=Acetobacteroides hydrogenigenes TaxID=979970 RepID=A0A4R2EKE1_9BACT|nr:MFS transporter [Acetobacteroides hydrogenigenes]TCN64719.1 fucose permease [Acetobacteroides hydrogenigenes]